VAFVVKIDTKYLGLCRIFVQKGKNEKIEKLPIDYGARFYYNDNNY
jgi:hypothetical protein